MPRAETAVAVFDDHGTVEDVVSKLAQAGFDMNSLTIVGKGFHVGEEGKDRTKIPDRFMSWGARGAFWGSLWGCLLSGAFLTLPSMGPVVVLGHLTATLIAVAEGNKIGSGLSTISGTLASIGVPHDSAIEYDAAIRADGFLVVAHGLAEDVARAKAIMASPGPLKVYTHSNPQAWPPTVSLNDAGA